MKNILLILSAWLGFVGFYGLAKAEEVQEHELVGSEGTVVEALKEPEHVQSVSQQTVSPAPSVQEIAAAIAEQLASKMGIQSNVLAQFPSGAQVVYLPVPLVSQPEQPQTPAKPASKDDEQDAKAMGHFLHALGTIGSMALNPKTDPVSTVASVVSDLLYVASMPFRTPGKNWRDVYLRALEEHIVTIVNDPAFVD